MELSITIPMTQSDMEVYEVIDKCVKKCMLRAEKKCRQLYMGGVPFSPELVHHLTNINFWQTVIRGKRVAIPICAQYCAYMGAVGSLGDH